MSGLISRVLTIGVVGVSALIVYYQKSKKPLFSFGVIADVQYADHDNSTDYTGKKVRRYRQAIESVSAAVKTWNTEIASKEPIEFIVQLGDLIDGKNKKLKESEKALNLVLERFKSSVCQNFHHALGNHELYNFDRDTVARLLMRDGKEYYAWSPKRRWRFIMLNVFDICVVGYPKTHDRYLEGVRLLKEKNPNDVLVDGTHWTKGMSGEDQRWIPYNGAIGPEQLKFLESNLLQARSARQHVVILSHVPFFNREKPIATAWNSPEVRALLGKFQKNVAVVLAGHEHDGYFGSDENGVTHVTLQSPLESGEGEVAYGMVRVFGDQLVLCGYGRVPSRVIGLTRL